MSGSGDHPSPKRLLQEHGLRARRSMGQNFLSDSQVARRIAEATGAGPGELVVEVGPGLGALTVHLVALGAQVVGVERDEALATLLSETLKDRSGLEIRVGDGRSFDYAAVGQEHGLVPVVVGNLPYNVAVPVLFRLIEQSTSTGDWVLMFQKEVADRIAAEPGSSDYGTLTVMVAPWRTVEAVLTVGPGAFYPAPKVASRVVRLKARPEPLFQDVDRALYRRVVQAAFGMRRKTLRNALKQGGFPEAQAILERAGIDGGRRGETLAPAEFAELARSVL